MSDGKITDEALATLRARIGVERVIREPFIEYVSRDAIRHVAAGLGDVSGLWLDSDRARAVGHSRLVAPPSILYAVAWGGGDLRRGEGLPGVHALHAGDTWRFYDYVHEGDRLIARASLKSLDLQPSTYSGTRVLQKRSIRFSADPERHIGVCRMSIIRSERGATRSSRKYAEVKLAQYTPDQLVEIEDKLLAESVRGSIPRYWEDTLVGEQIAGIVRGPHTVGDIVLWQLGFGGIANTKTGPEWAQFRRRYPNVALVDSGTGVPQSVLMVHYDREMASAVGMPAPYDIGAQRATWATVALTNWMGDGGFLAELDVQYRGMNFLGDLTTISGSVIDKWRIEEGNAYVDCELRAVNQRDEVTMPIRAVVALPSKERGPVSLPLDSVDDRARNRNATERQSEGIEG